MSSQQSRFKQGEYFQCELSNYWLLSRSWGCLSRHFPRATRTSCKCPSRNWKQTGQNWSDAATAEKFWPAYEAYRADIAPYKQDLLELIKRYAENYGQLTDDQAAVLIKDYMKLESNHLSIRKKHVKKMQRAVGDVLAMRFLQLENKMDALVDVGLSAQIPLAE
jgi:hypothetical protein